MSSFASLRSDRQSKQQKSIVSQLPSENPTSNPAMASVQATAAGSTSTDAQDVSISERLYKSLPSSVDIRVTQAGRGLFAKQAFKPGTLSRDLHRYLLTASIKQVK